MAGSKQWKVVRIALISGAGGAFITPLMFWLGELGLVPTIIWLILCPPAILMANGPRNIEYYEVLGVIAVLNGFLYGVIGAIISALKIDA